MENDLKGSGNCFELAGLLCRRLSRCHATLPAERRFQRGVLRDIEKDSREGDLELAEGDRGFELPKIKLQ